MNLNWQNATFDWMQPNMETGDGNAGEASWNLGQNPVFSNPEFVSLLGDGGLSNLYSDQYDSSFGFDRRANSMDFDPQKYQDTMQNLGVEFQRAYDGNMGYDRLVRNGQQLGRVNAFVNNPTAELAKVLQVAMNAVPGLGTTLGNLLGAGSGVAGQAVGNSLIGGTMAELGGGDFLKGAATGGLGSLSKSYNLAGAMGIENPNLQSAINRGATSVANAAIQGGDVVQAGLMGALPGLVNYGAAELGSMFTPETNMNFFDPMGAGMQTPQMDLSMYDPMGAGMTGSGEPSSGGSSFMQTLGNFMQQGIPNPLGGQRNIGFGDLAGGLLGLYSSYDQRRRARGLQRSLQDLYSPNSPYAQQMRQRLQRQDAAAGRRSQYGPRETQLAAMLTQNQASMAPTMQNLNSAIDGGNLNMARSMLNLGRLFTPQQSQPTSAVAPQNLSSMLQPYNWSNFGSPTVSYPDWLKTLGNSSLGG